MKYYRIWVPNCYSYIFCLFLIPLGILGCGSDEEDTPEDIVNTPEDVINAAEVFVGSWELLTIDGKTLKAELQQIDDEKTELLDVGIKVVFTTDGLWFKEFSVTIRELIAADPLQIFLKVRLRYTTTGRYVVSGSTVEFVTLENPNIVVQSSWETPGNPELKWQLVEDADMQQLRQGFEIGFKEGFQENVDFGLGMKTNTWHLEGDRLTFSKNGRASVYSRAL